MNDTTTPAPTDAIEQMAQRRAKAKMGWYTHATVYLLVNLFLAFLSARNHETWAVYPALGWGLGLLIHGVSVWFVMPGGGLYARLLAREREALKRQQGR